MGRDNDLVDFAEESGSKAGGRFAGEPWRILVVDDDEDVHTATEYALRDCTVLGRPLELLHSASASEAIATLSKERRIAVILLDAVMESDDAGLRAVRIIREELGILDTRIVLRTGQPGQVPELETIKRWDINDYKTKGELTRDRLVTTLIASIRSYDQIRRIDLSRKGLEKIVEASRNLMARRGLSRFAEGVITQIAGLLGVKAEGVVCARQSVDGGTVACRIIAAAGRFAELIDSDPRDIDDEAIAQELSASLSERRSRIGERSVTLYFASGDGERSFAAYIDSAEEVRDVDSRMIEVFCSNLSVSVENVELVERLKRAAYEDALVGLPNLGALIEAIDGTPVLNRGGRALAMLDIDQFGHINDALGHSHGDRVLVAVAERLKEAFGDGCVAARVSADEFAVYGPATAVNEPRLRAVLGKPVSTEFDEQVLSFSIGLLELSSDMISGGDAVKNASIALKRAQARGIGQAVRYSAAIGDEVRDSSRLLKALRAAFSEHELALFYQPQVSLVDGSPTGLEALLRWRTSNGSFVPPSRFIPLAEYSGLIVPLGDWILRSALKDYRRISQEGGRGLRVAVNVSAIQLRHPDFLASLDAALGECGVEGSALELEITESVSAMGIEDVARLIADIKRRGVSVAIDDFGTGYSSLSSIDRWPADRLKIDRSFVAGLVGPYEGGRIVDMVVPLGRNLSMTVLAEGVETEQERDYLARIGCAEAQGYLFGKPMPIEETLRWLERA